MNKITLSIALAVNNLEEKKQTFILDLCDTLNVATTEEITISPTPEFNALGITDKGKIAYGAIRYGRFNYGEIVECIVKIAYGRNGETSDKNKADLIIKGERIEIKALDRDSHPSRNNFRTRKTWLIANTRDYRGIYELTYDKLEWNAHNHLIASPSLAKATCILAL